MDFIGVCSEIYDGVPKVQEQVVSTPFAMLQVHASLCGHQQIKQPLMHTSAESNFWAFCA